jgi:hypothetical protein
LKKQLIQFSRVNYSFFSIHKKHFFLSVDIEPQRLKNDIKLLEDHLAERRLPIEQRELQKIAQNVIQNLINTERKTSNLKILFSFMFFF